MQVQQTHFPLPHGQAMSTYRKDLTAQLMGPNVLYYNYLVPSDGVFHIWPEPSVHKTCLEHTAIVVLLGCK